MIDIRTHVARHNDAMGVIRDIVDTAETGFLVRSQMTWQCHHDIMTSHHDKLSLDLRAKVTAGQAEQAEQEEQEGR